jgi:hypothetical protein
MEFDSKNLDLEALAEAYQQLGYVVLKGLISEATIAKIETDLALAQSQLVDGDLDEKYGSRLLDEPGALIDGKPYRHYVINCSDLSASVAEAASLQMYKDLARRVFDVKEPWLNDYARFGVVYQDSRADAGSKYSRIGWHSDFNSDEASVAWPSFAFTVHIDSTSPANGFLRVVPGSHRREIDRDEIGSWAFGAVPGEVPVFAERGDVILHDYKLWHSAARGTADGVAGRRRHVRGSWYGGQYLPREHGIGEFYKNAAR